MQFKLIRKRDLFFGFVCGFLSGIFLVLIIKNPYLEEFNNLSEIGSLIFILPLALSFLFAFGIFIAKVIFKSIKFLFQFAKFAETGVLNTLIDMGIYNGLIWFTGITSGALMIPLNIFSFSCATGNSYFWNKNWTFEKNDKAKAKEFIEFFAVTMVGMGINTLIVFIGTTLFSPMMGLSVGAWANLVKIGATFFSMVWNFVGYKFIVFKK